MQQWNHNESEKSMKVVNTEGENLHLLWTTWDASRKLSRKMRLIKILKVTKTGFHPLSKQHSFWKTARRGVKWTWEGGGKSFRKDVAYDNIKSKKLQGFTLFLENIFLEKSQDWMKLKPPSPFSQVFLGLKFYIFNKNWRK